MNDSILSDVKKLLGMVREYDPFDTDMIIFINSAFAVLNQLGVGPSTTFSISGYDDSWSSFSNDPNVIPLVKEYIYLKVKKSFEGPTLNSYVMSAIDNQIREAEFRLNVICDPVGIND